MAQTPLPHARQGRDDARGRTRPQVVALGPEMPSLNELFLFMRDAELRFGSLTMRIEHHTFGTRGETVETSELWLRHPNRAKVVTRIASPDGAPVSRDFRVWITDDEHVRTYDAQAHVSSVRPVRSQVEGLSNPDLPAFSRVYTPLTDLPMETLVDTFVHPSGFCRNVLATGRLELLGETSDPLGREAIVVRAHHPRTTQVLTDRPDRVMDVYVDRMTGLIVRLLDRIGDHVTRDALVTALELDPRIGDDAFALFLSEDVRPIY